jgi:hypothetical protein
VGEQHALAGDAIERRRLNDRVTIGPRVRPAPVVRDGEEDVRPRLRGRQPAGPRYRQRQRQQSNADQHPVDSHDGPSPARPRHPAATCEHGPVSTGRQAVRATDSLSARGDFVPQHTACPRHFQLLLPAGCLSASPPRQQGRLDRPRWRFGQPPHEPAAGQPLRVRGPAAIPGPGSDVEL